MRIEIYSIQLKLYHRIHGAFIFDKVCLVDPAREALLPQLFDPALVLPNALWWGSLLDTIYHRNHRVSPCDQVDTKEVEARKDWLIVVPISPRLGYVYNPKVARDAVLSVMTAQRQQVFRGVRLVHAGRTEHICDSCPGMVEFLMKKKCPGGACKEHLMQKFRRRTEWPKGIDTGTTTAEPITPPFTVPNIDF